MSSLLRHRHDVHSQNGEDGILAELLRRLGINDGWCVEFGAWDGKHLSNTYALVEQGWQAVYLEGDAEKYSDLLRTVDEHPGQIHPIHAFVKPTGDSSLDALLARTPIDADFDLLSIDIDSADWHIWDGLRNYRPKLVVIEINSSVPVGVEQTHGDGAEGSSFTSTLRLGRQKGYRPVCHTGNVIFVRDDLFPRVGLPWWECRAPWLLFQPHWVGAQPGWQRMHERVAASVARRVPRR